MTSVFVDLDLFKVMQMPPDVYVTYRRQVVAWLRSLRQMLDAGTVEMISAKARLSTTWQPMSSGTRSRAPSNLEDI